MKILNVEDAEAGYGHQMSGVPGSEVQGSMYWKAPEGDDISLTYSAGLEGYLAQGDHLPLSPEVPAAPEVVLPVMVDYTPEVAAARNAFMETFNEVKMKAAEEMVEVTERRRREADMEDTAVVVDMEDEKMAESPSVPLFAPLAVPHLTQGLQPWAGLLLPARTVGQYPQYPVFNTFPGLVWNTQALTPVQSLVPRVIGTEGLLPSQKLEGEDEPAALEF